jgi:rubrerythrin
VPAYTKAFLDSAVGAENEGKNLYRCRVCGRLWEKRPPEGEGKRPSLVKVS